TGSEGKSTTARLREQRDGNTNRKATTAFPSPGVCRAVPRRDGYGTRALRGPGRACGVRASRALPLTRGTAGIHGASPDYRRHKAPRRDLENVAPERMAAHLAAGKEVMSLECQSTAARQEGTQHHITKEEGNKNEHDETPQNDLPSRLQLFGLGRSSLRRHGSRLERIRNQCHRSRRRADTRPKSDSP